MNTVSALEIAGIARELLFSGDTDESLRVFGGVFHSSTGDLRSRLVLEMPEFFMGGTGATLPSVTIDGMASGWFDLISQTSISERIGLFGLAVTVMPERMLEIGRARGGGTVILNAARRFSGCKHFVSLDPNCKGEHYLNEKLRGLLIEDGVKLIDGFSPQENRNALSLAGGTFDFVFIDGDHSFESCLRDLRGVLDVLSDSGYVVLHDANYPGVQDAVNEVLKVPGLVDCGFICRDRNTSCQNQVYRGRPVIWGGLRLLRKGRSEGLVSSLLAKFGFARN